MINENNNSKNYLWLVYLTNNYEFKIKVQKAHLQLNK